MDIVVDSRKVTRGSIFVALRGTTVDSHKFMDAAAAAGAAVIVCEELPENRAAGVEYRIVTDSRIALSDLACQKYGNPSAKLTLVGVTGTNGKTTTATLLHNLFTALGYKCGLLSTVVNKIGSRDVASTMTTPDPLELNSLLADMANNGCSYCFMEVSSHSLVQKRTHGLTFAGGIFTNLTHDHLDYHGTFAEYLKAKKSFFDNLPAAAFAITNADDKNGNVMLQNCAASHVSYSLRSLAHYNCRIIEEHLGGMQLRLNGAEIWVQFIGRFNAYNLTAVYAAAVELGQQPDQVLQALSTLHSVAGRFDIVRGNAGQLAIVDYAHTPDALKNVLDTVAELNAAKGVIVVVGCGGDRDSTKRPIMAKIAFEGSSKLILTSDNPRNENPTEILNQMAAGLSPQQLSKTLIIEDRAQAIKTAAALAQNADIIVIAGKGHETYQDIKGVKTHFDDKEQIAQCFDI